MRSLIRCLNRAAFAATAALLAIIPLNAATADWSECADDLDRVRSSASDASDLASEVETAKSALESCRSDTDSYEYRYDKCVTEAEAYDTVIDELNNELDSLNSRIHDASLSCSSAPRKATPRISAKSRCALYRKYLGRLPRESIMNVCRSAMTEEQCKLCLSH